MADEAYRAVFLRVHPTGKMVLSLTTEPDGKEPQYAQQAPPAPEDDSTAQLQNLAALHTQGVLTDEEFAAAKAKILGI